MPHFRCATAPCGTCIRWNSGGCVSSSVSCSARMANKRPCEFQSYLLFQEREVELGLCMYTIYISCNSKHKLTESWWSVLKLIEEQHLLRCNGHLNVRSNHKISTAQHCENLQTSDSKVIKKAYEGVHTWGTKSYKSSTSMLDMLVSSINDSFWGTTSCGKPMENPHFFAAVARASSGASRWWCRRPGVDPTPQAGNSWEISWDFMGTRWPKYGSKYRSIYIYPPVLWSQNVTTMCKSPAKAWILGSVWIIE